MPVSSNYTPLASNGNVYLIDSQQPAGVYLANRLADGSMDLLERVEYVENLQAKVETLAAAIATYESEAELLRTKPASATSRTSSRKDTNRALAAALAARGKSKKKGATDWPEWVRAKKLLAEGRSIEEAADLA